jgi:hypothetical protein
LKHAKVVVNIHIRAVGHGVSIACQIACDIASDLASHTKRSRNRCVASDRDIASNNIVAVNREIALDLNIVEGWVATEYTA